jgi:hypothetical protein
MLLVPLLLLSAVPECPPVRPDSPGLAQLSWLAGAWSGDDRGTLNEEVWLAPAGGMMLAMHRDTAGLEGVGLDGRCPVSSLVVRVPPRASVAWSPRCHARSPMPRSRSL